MAKEGYGSCVTRGAVQRLIYPVSTIEGGHGAAIAVLASLAMGQMITSGHKGPAGIIQGYMKAVKAVVPDYNEECVVCNTVWGSLLVLLSPAFVGYGLAALGVLYAMESGGEG